MSYDGGKVIKIAQGEVGTTEGPNDDNKYGRALNQNHEFWCSLFVSFVMRKAGFESLYPITASTRVSYADYRNKQWIIPKSQARPGDIVWMFFPPRQGPVNHIGFLTGLLANGSVMTIDGNSVGPRGEGVWRHTYRGSVVAVGRPGGRGAVDPPTTPPFPGHPVQRGSHGEDVTFVQRNLNRFLPVDIPVSGVFDTATERALVKWQRNRLIPAASIGHVGPGTWPMLAAPVFSQTLKSGSRGKAVQQLKVALNKLGNQLDAANPDFGAKTDEVVRTWQRNRRQRVDGIVDMVTWYWMHIPKKADEIEIPNLHPGS
jgi:peptidoglycan hydrolase-like protein with peptidoglycan-binding domain